MTRLRDIARQAGVAANTVSKALRDAPDLSPATKARIRLLAQQLGYVPDSAARTLRTRRTKLFGLVISSMTNPIYSRVVLAIEEGAHEMGYDVLFAHTLNIPEREEACIRQMLSRRVDGLFIAPVYRLASEARIYQEVLARRVPTVVLGHTTPFCNQFINVETDDLQASYTVTRHLLKLGHRRIAFLGGPPATPWTQERLEGYRQALREANLEEDDKLIFTAGRTLEEGAAAARQILAEDSDITAVQAVNDLVAAGCAEAFLEEGFQIPQDVSIAGFGNILLGAHFRTPLTTTRQPKFRLGRAAVRTMRELLLGRHPESSRLPAELIVRASTGTPPAARQLRLLK